MTQPPIPIEPLQNLPLAGGVAHQAHQRGDISQPQQQQGSGPMQNTEQSSQYYAQRPDDAAFHAPASQAPTQTAPPMSIQQPGPTSTATQHRPTNGFPPPMSRAAAADQLPNVAQGPPPPVSAHNAAAEYLDQFDHNPAVQQMMSRAQSRTVRGASTAQMPESASIFSVDKPLPNPGLVQDVGGVQNPYGPIRAPSRHQPSSASQRRRPSRTGGSILSQDDRFPVFTMTEREQHMVPVLLQEPPVPQHVPLPE